MPSIKLINSLTTGRGNPPIFQPCIMTNTEYIISIIILFTAIISPALIVGFIAEYISKRKN